MHSPSRLRVWSASPRARGRILWLGSLSRGSISGPHAKSSTALARKLPRPEGLGLHRPRSLAPYGTERATRTAIENHLLGARLCDGPARDGLRCPRWAV